MNILDDNVRIAKDNLEKLSRAIALSSLKQYKRFAFGYADKVHRLYKNLQYDICYHKNTDVYSDAYDLVQEASLFLMQYMGKRLGDECVYIKSTKKQPTRINIRYACFKNLSVYLRKELKNGNTESEEVLEFVPVDNNYEEKQDYTKVFEIVKRIVTTKLELEILEYYYNGVEPKLIAEFLNISADKVYKRRRKFKDRYLQIYG